MKILQKKNNYLKNLIFFFIFLQNLTIFSKELENLLIKKIGLNAITKKTTYDYTKTKIKNLNFNEVSSLYILCLKEKKGGKLLLNSLQRMYYLCSDTNLSEYILFEYGLQNEKMKNYAAAFEIFGIFKRLYPGSNFYWEARLKEIQNLFNLNYEYRLDDEKNLALIDLCRQYEYDCVNFSENSDFCKVILIMQTCYINQLKKIVYIAKDYLNKYRYIQNSDVLISTLSRIQEINDYIETAILYNQCNKNCNYKSEKYNIILKSIKDNIENYFSEVNFTKLEGKYFLIEREKAINYLNQNSKIIQKKSEALIYSTIKELNKF